MYYSDGRVAPGFDDDSLTYDEGMRLSAADVAAELRRRLPNVGTTKLHKLLYYCQGHHLAATGEPIFGDSLVAFDKGPVVSRLWKMEQEHGPNLETKSLDQAALNTVGYVVSRYGQLTARDLVNLTHSEDPWRRADEGRAPGSSVRIEPETMLRYFTADADDPGPDELTLDPAEVVTWLAGASDRLGSPTLWDSTDELRRRIDAG